MSSIYLDALATGLFEGHRGADLYIRDTPQARALLAKHGKKIDGWSVVSFSDQSTDKRTRLLEIPFAYTA